MLGSLTSEYAELLSRLAVKQAPMEMGQELHVGQLFCCSPCHITPALCIAMNDVQGKQLMCSCLLCASLQQHSILLVHPDSKAQAGGGNVYDVLCTCSSSACLQP